MWGRTFCKKFFPTPLFKNLKRIKKAPVGMNGKR